MNESDSLPPDWGEGIFESVMEITKFSKFLIPSEYSYYSSSNPGFKLGSNKLSQKLKRMILHMISSAEKLVGAPEIEESELENFDDLIESYELIVELVDSLLERTAKNLEEVMTKGKKKVPEIFQRNAMILSLKNPSGDPDNSFSFSRKYNVLYSENIPRPQLQFEDKIDNTNSPFVSKLVNKVNAMVPLNYTYSGEAVNGYPNMHMDGANATGNGNPVSLNPYHYEIMHIDYLDRQKQVSPEQLYLPLEQTEFIWVDTLEKLENLSKVLDNSLEFGVDLENHSCRSYLGFTCIMQISTRTQDYIVDTIALRSHVHILNSSFTNPKIIKIFHAANMDIKWLQRDCGIFVVNMFDTGQASRVLMLPHHSLEYLLKKYCNVQTNKQYQIADWRLRPLTDKMIEYARKDSHYLPYIYDKMRNELIEASEGDTSKLDLVYRRSEAVCSQTFTKEVYNHELGEESIGWKTALKKTRASLSDEQIYIFRDLHRWRDAIARQEDESPAFVIPTSLLSSISQMMPTTVPALLELSSNPPPMVKQFCTDIIRVVKDAREKYISEALQNFNSASAERVSQEQEQKNFPRNDNTKNVGVDSGMIFDTFLEDHADGIQYVQAKTNPTLFSENLAEKSVETPEITDLNQKICKRFFRSMSDVQKNLISTMDSFEMEELPSKRIKISHQVEILKPSTKVSSPILNVEKHKKKNKSKKDRNNKFQSQSETARDSKKPFVKA